ncbi:MAG: bifunctional (p)ppGpp synthetase/guanosine-3',5'-bis(diphosphate) 3'-pyrophosphohydrolase [Betaproteobacteria bacterium]|nr:bifunctional (p)ppGpp synthetase/guanosine-3',5'-bis(diphosphate) 3'-pyrophosphohydrolase [Betaproteobacteria bacterium]MDE2423329.1 bifunctional (p)ppGpp synthetase/guanosine-3',5'-bis(diphosphate) 3'-pyrophosphohydrolase [Betaproteobacteria bacterium]
MPTTAQVETVKQVTAKPLIHLAASYLRPEDIDQLQLAFDLAEKAHTGQIRKSGEPYITHPLSVASILAEWHLDVQALIAALLHDTVEDTSTTSIEIAEKFGKPIADLVDGVSKLDRIESQTEQQAQAENFRKMLLAMARDVRVILIKLADRLHNMRTLGAMKETKQRRIARETLDIYGPIANRLGLHAVYQEMQDLCFFYLFPNRYQVLSKAVKAARGNRREVVGKILTTITQRLDQFGIEATVTGREKNIYSIYKKMIGKSLSFSEVLDIYGFRILVKDMQSCYLALGALHTLYKPIPGKFKDYIAIPKANGYQSLHTTLFGPYGTPIELQIRTSDMHKIAESGVASHWLYKSTETPLTDVQQKTHQWLQSLLEMQTESGDAVEFLEHLKVDLFPDQVYVFTPKGNIKSLPKGATAVDFAYDVHTDIGNRCVAAKINNELAPLRTTLSNGDRVEIITADNAAPNPSWLNYVVSAKARSKIRHYLRTMLLDESIELGRRLLNQALRALKINPSDITENQWEFFLKRDRCKTQNEVLTEIGLGKRLNIVVAKGLLSNVDKDSHERPGSITIRGSEGIAVQFAHCCRPIPGDAIIGIIKKGQGLLIHTQDCRAIKQYRSDPDKWVDVEWENNTGKLFDVEIKLMAVNRRGVLATVAAAIAEAQSNIDSVSINKPDGTYSEINFTVQVTDTNHLASLFQRLRDIPEVVRITRVQS